MEKVKAYGCIFLAIVSGFTIGIYATITVKYGGSVEPHRWVMTSLFGLMWLFLGISLIRKLK